MKLKLSAYSEPQFPALSLLDYTLLFLHDASTDIEALVKDFAKDMTAEVEKLRNARLEKQKNQDTIKNPASKKSTPASVPVVTFDLEGLRRSVEAVYREIREKARAEKVGAGCRCKAVSPTGKPP